MALQFGVAATPITDDGYIQNYTRTSSCEIGEARDENGDVAAIQEYNEKYECEFEYVFAGTAPTAGDTIQADGSNYFVLTSVAEVETNQGYKTLSCSGTHYITNSIPAE